jgi:steroid 5-alpha reductase family enzyme
LFVFFLAIETIADNQQWNFQQSKRNLIPKQEHLKADYKRGFLTQGLFAYSRHPNFFAE